MFGAGAGQDTGQQSAFDAGATEHAGGVFPVDRLGDAGGEECALPGRADCCGAGAEQGGLGGGAHAAPDGRRRGKQQPPLHGSAMAAGYSGLVFGAEQIEVRMGKLPELASSPGADNFGDGCSDEVG